MNLLIRNKSFPFRAALFLRNGWYTKKANRESPLLLPLDNLAENSLSVSFYLNAYYNFLALNKERLKKQVLLLFENIFCGKLVRNPFMESWLE